MKFPRPTHPTVPVLAKNKTHIGRLWRVSGASRRIAAAIIAEARLWFLRGGLGNLDTKGKWIFSA